MREIKVLEAGLADPFSVAGRPVGNLQTFSFRGLPLHRVKVAGVVTAQFPGKDFYVADATGSVCMTTRRDGGWAEICVVDTGTGIPEAVRGRIFTPFFTTKEVGRGTGQGLAIAHAVVVKKHGGTLDFETDEGKGTTFIIRLPIEGAPPKSS